MFILINHMTDINLHQIFRYLTGNEKLLSTILDNTNTKNKSMTKSDKVLPNKKTKPGKKFDIMSSMITEYIPLVPYETQPYDSFPQVIKNYLTIDHVRLGIKHIIEKDMANVNVSFLNSLNILLRPDIYYLNNDDYVRDLSLLEDFIKHRIIRNFQIDKVVKNTKRVQTINKELVKNISEGKITHDLIQYVVNIFEINLMVFDFITHDITLYWTHGSKHPDFNVFKNIHYMAYVQGNYEPVLSNNIVSKQHTQSTYIKLLLDKTIKSSNKIKLDIRTLIAIDTWDNVTDDEYVGIIEKYFRPVDPT